LHNFSDQVARAKFKGRGRGAHLPKNRFGFARS
jgi:hypothetical protein